jgi:5'-nucleotidase / UDP-sugar diphosphatase
MTYTLTIDSLQQCVKTEMLDKKMKPLDESKTYKVALNSYVAASYHFDHADPGTTSYTTTAQALIDYLTKVKTVDYKGTRRIFMNRAGGLK